MSMIKHNGKWIPESEYRMGVLSYIPKEHDLSDIERETINYAISVIKTLADMGVIK